ncbi:MAG: hypothetical protein Q8M98_03210 [Candidatus Cloacimonadaceae bacterium]|nr:hypothetical protein [Candidatus Cloacimonadaceae bacterium]MDP3113764.1 hypothetical protein [Candidatus Cloacimonadaceae bacterium]
MKEKFENTENMTPQEKFNAVASLQEQLEDNFLILGQLLSEIKRGKLYRFKGYESLKDFVENEYKMSSSLAGKLAQTFDLFIEEMDVDESTIKDIGFDRLQMIRPIVQKANWEDRDAWVEKAAGMPTKDLRSHIKELKDKEKDEDPDLRKVFVDQFMEKMIAWFNCSRSELNFRLALYFQDADPEQVKLLVKERQRAFETELQSNKEDTN